MISLTAFLDEFVSRVARKSKQVNQAMWILETTGSGDAAELKAGLDAELRFLFNDSDTYKQLAIWKKEERDPLLKRQCNVLVRAFQQNQIPKAMLEETAMREAALSQEYGNFRPELNGKKVSENEIREVLKNENVSVQRKKAWEASKQIGRVLAPQILSLVRLRNKAAHSLGYSDYFQMQLDLQEVDGKWLLKTFEEAAQKSDRAYSAVVEEIERAQCERFHVTKNELGPWAWAEPFCQEDPLDQQELDSLVNGVDIPHAALAFYRKMGIDVEPILQRSDLFERSGKNQHAFCVNMDRERDIRTLNNVTASLKWLETVLHELGHAIYELGYEKDLPWLLKEPPHMITTEAMALIAGRQAYLPDPLKGLVGSKPEHLLNKVAVSLRRRQLIFSRWVMVMTAFESELYRNPDQNLNRLWWQLVEKYQKVEAPKDRESQWDWACKYHIGLAPVDHYSYLLGEMFASAIQKKLTRECGSPSLTSEKAGQFLNHKLFGPGNRMPWSDLVQYVTGYPLTPDAWVEEFS